MSPCYKSTLAINPNPPIGAELPPLAINLSLTLGPPLAINLTLGPPLAINLTANPNRPERPDLIIAFH
jgi:hypothetical protein